MTTVVYFVLAALALLGAGVLLWLDRNRSEQVHHQRAVWGQTHGFKFRDSDRKLRSAFHRAAMDVPDHVEARDVAYGVYEGAEAVVFDLEETATIVAVRRPAASSVTVDLRHEDVLAPAEDDVELLGAMGPRVMFASNLDAARRVCDRRMVALATSAPSYIEVLWNEGNWALGAMPPTTDGQELDVALDVVRRFADLLRVLPPTVDPQGAPDPRDPHGPHRPELADKKTDSLHDEARRQRLTGEAPAAPQYGVPGQPAPAPQFADPEPYEAETAYVPQQGSRLDATPRRDAAPFAEDEYAEEYEDVDYAEEDGYVEGGYDQTYPPAPPAPQPPRPAPFRNPAPRGPLDPPDLPPLDPRGR
ncbi:MAG: hypothetical protein QM774_09470 [Gordonia sp. (in: high G+C Gram-positive bacteria)]|uniref:hypothetical protein n=1 Tax=Gordonia sp. (in: high G+C Gram-positive bacteria) TaxID=84139 RepID=UPI0039E2E4B3